MTELPYATDALAPYINKQTVEIHHGKHHKKYVTTTNELIKGTEMEGDDVVRQVCLSPTVFQLRQSFSPQHCQKVFRNESGII